MRNEKHKSNDYMLHNFKYNLSLRIHWLIVVFPSNMYSKGCTLYFLLPPVIILKPLLDIKHFHTKRRVRQHFV